MGKAVYNVLHIYKGGTFLSTIIIIGLNLGKLLQKYRGPVFCWDIVYFYIMGVAAALSLGKSIVQGVSGSMGSVPNGTLLCRQFAALSFIA